MSLDLYTASAGSGKTHTLTREYLRLALSTSDPNTFRHIQAVTFTNKATAEMKERIIQELYALAKSPEDSPFFAELKQALHLDPEGLKQRAQGALRALLLDYTSFRVRTIDSFFQEVVRSFAYELGVTGGLRVQIESSALLHQAVLEVLADQDGERPDNQIKAWIQALAEDNLSSGKSYHIETSLEAFAKQLEEEPVKLLRQNKGLPTKKSIADLQEALKNIIDNTRRQAKRLATDALEALRATGIPPEDIKSGTKFPLGALKSCVKASGEIFESSSKGFYSERVTLQKVCQASDPEEQLDLFLTKEKLERYRAQLEPHLASIIEHVRAFDKLCREKGGIYVTALVIYEYLGSYGLLIDIDNKLQELKQEQGTMLLADAPSLISKLLKDAQTDTPFLYEKIGAKIRHHMIDEFQDTSRLQYDNFHPLLQEAMASGNDSLIVGDAKQSIYRFRNSDSTLLTRVVPEDFAQSIKQTSLQDNWRSVPEIIEFNNQLYQQIIPILGRLFTECIEALPNSTLDKEKEPLLSTLRGHLVAYEDVKQLVPEKKRKSKGLVALHEYTEEKKNGRKPQAGEADEEDKEKASSNAFQQIPLVLIDLQKRGYRPMDIAILVRNKKAATDIAEILQNYPKEKYEGYSLSFISQEALLVSSAVSTRFIVAALAYISSNGAALQRALLLELHSQLARTMGTEEPSPTLDEETLRQLLTIGRRGLYEAAEEILHLFQPILPDQESAYVVHLLDMLYTWETEQSADIPSFLEYWADGSAEERILTPTNEQACSLMTIHKSKGLGFPVVLLPDLGWELDASTHHENILWCSTEGKETDELPLQEIASLPLKYSRKLYYTLFAREYLEERMNYTFDALNLLYVATTRAKEELHIWLPTSTDGKKKEKNEPLSSIPKDIKALLMEGADGKPLWQGLPAEVISEEQGASEEKYPQLIQRQAIPTSLQENILQVDSIISHPITDRIAILRKGLDYFSEEQQLRYGHTMHLILAEIETTEDIEGALERAISQGLIAPDEEDDVRQSLLRVVSHSDCARWFDGSGVVRNECSIIGGGLEGSRRPDRIVFYADEGADRDQTSVEIIDYKFGHFDKRYYAQIQGYQALLQRMGYRDVKGWLCYIEKDKIKVVPVPPKR
nr:UvrD-helicase domain-containing protein [uncultured Porphyromonas sp.]